MSAQRTMMDAVAQMQGAKPAAGAVDLRHARLTDEQAAVMQEQMEMHQGMRCVGCGRRVALGFRFLKIDPRGRPSPTVHTVVACSREDCDYAEQLQANGATAMQVVEWAWLDGADIDAVSSRRAAEPEPVPASSSRSDELHPPS